MMFYNGGLLGGFGFFGFFFMILFWGVIIWGVVYLVKSVINGSNRSSDSKNSPMDILKERYAKGEVDKKEFEEKRKELEK